uniref:39S ribosomal protein L35, mitochondrial n=1 Tax=Syphacia muris TaxID=451379 RepID=A0A0N5A8M4_9BILA
MFLQNSVLMLSCMKAWGKRCLSVSGSLINSSCCNTGQVRTIARIPHYEYHIRFDPTEGRKRPCQDVLDRFKRLNNGLWIHMRPGNHKLRYWKDETYQKTSEYYETCTKEECFMLDRMMTPFWLRPHYYINDPYEPYHERNGLKPKGRMKKRPKILLEDTVVDKFFNVR